MLAGVRALQNVEKAGLCGQSVQRYVDIELMPVADIQQRVQAVFGITGEKMSDYGAPGHGRDNLLYRRVELTEGVAAILNSQS